MTVGPKTIMQDVLAVNALKMMEEFSITSVFVVENDGDNIPIGVIHIHDLLRAKIV
jgi:arabinose-5-phosphate isomerase